MKTTILVLLVVFVSSPPGWIGGALAQSQFQITIGGTNSEYGNSIIQTTDGGYAVAGSTLSFGAGDYYLYILKLDASGILQWGKTINGPNND